MCGKDLNEEVLKNIVSNTILVYSLSILFTQVGIEFIRHFLKIRFLSGFGDLF
jgi:hypothetical protein